MKLRYRLLCTLAVLALPPLVIAAGSVGEKIAVRDIFVRAAPPVSTNTALFLTLQNRGEADRFLSGVSSPAAKAAEIHLTRHTDKGMEMSPVEEVSLKAGGTVTFSTEGYHVMLIGLVAPLSEGESIPVTFAFRDGGTLTVDAPVKKGSDLAGEHHH